MPKENSDYWKWKLGRNAMRDKRDATALIQAGWRVFIVWECETRNKDYLLDLADRIREIQPHRGQSGNGFSEKPSR